VDHGGILRDSKTGRPINGMVSDDEDENYADTMRKLSSLRRGRWMLIGHDFVAGYSFFDSYDVDLLGRGRTRSAHYRVGMFINVYWYFLFDRPFSYWHV